MLHAISAYSALKMKKANPDKGAEWHDSYGIWFAGTLRTSVKEKHGAQSWVFLDTKPDKLEEGEHEVDVWGKQGLLVFWRSQGFPRGVIAFAVEIVTIKTARQIAQTKPWSFEQILSL
jgi:hypothetical protein